MTISTTTQRSTTTGTGTETAIAVAFKFYATSDLVVTKRITATGVETTLTLDTHYSVSGGNGETGTVTVISGSTNFPSSVTWTLTRVSPRTQTLDLAQNDAFPADSVEAQLDKLVLQVQDLKEQVDRSLKYPATDVSSLGSELPHSVDRSATGSILGFSTDGEPVITTSSLDTALTTPYTLTLLDDVDAATARATLELADGSTRVVASGAAVAVTFADANLSVTGSTAIDFFTGGTAGQHLLVIWAASATFQINNTVTGSGQINLVGAAATGNLTGVANQSIELLSDGTDWFEISRNTQNQGSRSVSSAAAIAVTAADNLIIVSGSTTVDRFTGGQPGQSLFVYWASGATFTVAYLGGGGAGQISTITGEDIVGREIQNILHLINDGSVWNEVSTGIPWNFTTVASPAGGSIAVGTYQPNLTITGSNKLDNLTGGSPGHRLVIHWAASATFDIGDAATGAGEIHLSTNVNITDHVANDTLTLISDGTDWYEIARSTSASLIELTIVSGVVTVTKPIHLLDGETSPDDLDTINGGWIGMTVTLKPGDDARTMNVKNGTGNIKISTDMVLNNLEDGITIIYDGTNWTEVGRAPFS